MRLRVLQNFGADPIWTNVTITSVPLLDVVYNDVLDLWCIVGQTKTILTSPDGTTWTSRTAGAGAGSAMSRVAFGDSGVFVAQRGNNDVDTSPDGVTWTARSLGQVTAIDQALAIAYSPSLDRWTAVCNTNAEQSYTSNAQTSPWSNVFGNLSAGEVLWDDVNGLFVYADRNNRIVMTSSDGISSFTACTSPGTKDGSDNADAIAWDGIDTYIVVLGHNGTTATSRMWRNSSGDPLNGTWVDVTHPFGAHKITSIAYSPSQDTWRACSNGGLLGVSTDGGVTWTLETVPTSTTHLWGINWSEELQQWIAVGQVGTSPGAGLIFLLS